MAHILAWNDLQKEKQPKKSKRDKKEEEEVDWDKPPPKDEGGEFEDQDDDVSITESEGKAKAVNFMAKSIGKKSKKRRTKFEHPELTALLKAMREEPWEHLDWIDQDDPRSYEAFDRHFGIDRGIAHLPKLYPTMTNQQWLDHISAPRFDHTKKAFCEMTFPQKGVRDPLLFGKKLDMEGWESVDPDAPEEEGYEYRSFTRSEEDEEDSYTEYEYNSDDSDWETVSDDDSDWETEEDEGDDSDEDAEDQEENDTDTDKESEENEVKDAESESESELGVKGKYFDAFWNNFTNTDFGWLYGEGNGGKSENVRKENSEVENMEVDNVGAEETVGGEPEKAGENKDDAMEMSGTEEGAADNGDKMDIDE
ncbi:MAG: hypothetical protein Q9167_004509 [Letrouitia subvulpina]